MSFVTGPQPGPTGRVLGFMDSHAESSAAALPTSIPACHARIKQQAQTIDTQQRKIQELEAALREVCA